MAQNNQNDTLPNAEGIIKRFGGIRPMATKLGVPVTTVQGWKKRNAIPTNRKGDIVVDTDEGPRPDTTIEGLAKLRTVFDREGTVTAGNASTISDGAAAVVVADEATAAKAPWKFKILASHTSGTEPKDLFIAPVAAVEGVLAKAGLTTDDIDLFEINEAFASQMVACLKGLKLDDERVNIYGGGISLGHPIGASGTRVLVTLMHALMRTGKKRGVASLCLGGGNAVAMAIELVA